MLDFFQIKQHRIVFSIFTILVILVLVIMITLGLLMFLGKGKTGYNRQNPNVISFSGEGKIFAKPDIAMVTLSVVTESKTVADVQKKNTEKMNKVIDFLKGFGIEDKDIKTTNYNLYPRYDYSQYSSKMPQIIGYEITQSLEVKMRNLDKVGDILEGSVNAGANQIYSLYFKVDKDEEFKAQAKELAIKDAKKKAEETAKQLGVRLGKLSGYSEGGGYYPPIYSNYDKAIGVGGGGESAPNIQTGENEILVNVTLTYEID
jgi:uncharacterized protein YggE